MVRKLIIQIMVALIFVSAATYAYWLVGPSKEAIANTKPNPSCQEGSADVLRLYQSFFGRAPDKQGANYWLNAYNSGRLSYGGIATNFANSAEFANKYSNMNNRQFVERIYYNVLRRAPDQQGWDYWVRQLNNGMSRRDLVVNISRSKEFKRLNPYPYSTFCRNARQVLTSKGYRLHANHPGMITGHKRTSNQSINAVMIELKRPNTKMRVSPGHRKQVVGAYARQIGAEIAINGNWFTSTSFDGPSMSGGRNYGGNDHHYTSLVGFNNTQPGRVYLLPHQEIRNVPTWIKEGISGHPTLTWQGRNAVGSAQMGDPTNSNRNPRSAIGVSSDSSTVILVTVDGRSRSAIGMTARELAEVMLELGADRSVMLDGGGSSTLWVAGRGVINRPSDGRPRAVANQLAVQLGNWVQ